MRLTLWQWRVHLRRTAKDLRALQRKVQRQIGHEEAAIFGVHESILHDSAFTGKIAVSSVNWSNTSLSKNREAGAVLSGDGSVGAAQFMATVFADDFRIAPPLVPNVSAFSAVPTMGLEPVTSRQRLR